MGFCTIQSDWKNWKNKKKEKRGFKLTKLHTLPLAHIFPGKKKEKAKNIGKTDQ